MTLNDQQTDKPRKNIVQVFKDFRFKLEIKTNLIEFDFLKVTFSLINGTFRPYEKPNNDLSYINVFSNHPPNKIKRSTNSTNVLLSRNYSSQEIFDNNKEDYQKARGKLGYKTKLLYKESSSNNTNGKKKQKKNSKNNTSNKLRKRKIIWFNPPYNKSVVSSVGKIF